MLSSMAQQSIMPPAFPGSQQATSPAGERPPAQSSSDVERGETREAAATSMIGTQSQLKHSQALPIRGLYFVDNLTLRALFEH